MITVWHTAIGYNLQSGPGTRQRAWVPVLFLHGPTCQRLKKKKYGWLNFKRHILCRTVELFFLGLF